MLTTAEGDLTVPQDGSLTGTVEISFTRDAATVNTWNLYVLDASAPNNLKKIEGGSSSGGGGGSSGDVQAEEARAKAVENALSAQILANTADIADHQLSIDQISADLTAATEGLSAYLPLSGGVMTGSLDLSTNQIHWGDKTYITNYDQAMTIEVRGDEYKFPKSGVTPTSADVIRRADLDNAISSTLSDAWEGNLSGANANNPVMLSSDLSALVEKAIKFKGAVETSSDLPSTNVSIGDMYIITGDGTDAGAEFVCTNLTGSPEEPVWSELGREGTTAALWTAVTTLSTETIPNICTDLSNAISANADDIAAISDVIENGISTAIEGITADIDTLSNTTIPTLCTDLSNAITDITSDIDGISTDIYGEDGLSAQVTNMSEELVSISNDIYDSPDGLSVKTTSLRTDVDNLQDDLNTVSSDLATMSGDLEDVSAAVSALQNDQVEVTIDDLSSTQLNVKHISEADYHQLVIDNNVLSNTIYIVSADGYQNMYGERITNLSTVSSDNTAAANVSFVTAYVGDAIAAFNTDLTDDIEYLSNAISANQSAITTLSGDISYLSGEIDDLAGMMVSAVVISGDSRAITADVADGVATISGLSVSDFTWDIDVINGGDSGYTPPVEP